MRGILVGLGNPNFADDGIGFWVVKALEGEMEAVHLLSPTLSMLKYLLGYERAVIVDGTKSGAEPGKIVEFFLKPGMNRKLYGGTSHTLSLEEVITVGYETFGNRMPPLLKFIGVEVGDTETFGRELSESVKRALPEVERRVRAFLKG